jgi:hypothetical protein
MSLTEKIINQHIMTNDVNQKLQEYLQRFNSQDQQKALKKREWIKHLSLAYDNNLNSTFIDIYRLNITLSKKLSLELTRKILNSDRLELITLILDNFNPCLNTPYSLTTYMIIENNGYLFGEDVLYFLVTKAYRILDLNLFISVLNLYIPYFKNAVYYTKNISKNLIYLVTFLLNIDENHPSLIQLFTPDNKEDQSEIKSIKRFIHDVINKFVLTDYEMFTKFINFININIKIDDLLRRSLYVYYTRNIFNHKIEFIIEKITSLTQNAENISLEKQIKLNKDLIKELVFTHARSIMASIRGIINKYSIDKETNIENYLTFINIHIDKNYDKDFNLLIWIFNTYHDAEISLLFDIYCSAHNFLIFNLKISKDTRDINNEKDTNNEKDDIHVYNYLTTHNNNLKLNQLIMNYVYYQIIKSRMKILNNDVHPIIDVHLPPVLNNIVKEYML